MRSLPSHAVTVATQYWYSSSQYNCHQPQLMATALILCTHNTLTQMDDLNLNDRPYYAHKTVNKNSLENISTTNFCMFCTKDVLQDLQSGHAIDHVIMINIPATRNDHYMIMLLHQITNQLSLQQFKC